MARILFVEDNLQDQYLYKKFLKNHIVTCVTNAKDAIKKSRNKFDLIVIDIHLGTENGYEAYAKLKKLHDCSFIITSGSLPAMKIVTDDKHWLVDKNNLIDFINDWNIRNG